jgi:hypothetical protein
LAGWDVRKVPQKDALVKQKAMTRNRLESVIEQIAHDGLLPHAANNRPDVAVTTADSMAALRFSTPECWFVLLAPSSSTRVRASRAGTIAPRHEGSVTPISGAHSRGRGLTSCEGRELPPP